jgi:hypothetical protein
MKTQAIELRDPPAIYALSMQSLANLWTLPAASLSILDINNGHMMTPALLDTTNARIVEESHHIERLNAVMRVDRHMQPLDTSEYPAF